MLPFAIEYPAEPEEGYWGIQTSTIDWCEENYVVSPYIAEAMNTVTNAGFVVLATFALMNVLREKHDSRFIIVALGFITVGVGSWMFHMTLLYEYQLLDELPMIYATCVPYWTVFSSGKSRATSIRIGIQVALGAALLTGIYLYFKNPTIHQAAYGALNLMIIYKSVCLSSEHVKDEAAQKHLWHCLVIGLTSFMSGYLLWNLDIHFCETWRAMRRSVGMPYGFLLEGHAWWHLLTGTGVYYYIVYLEYLQLYVTGREKDYKFVWGWLIPWIERKSDADRLQESKKSL